MAADIGDVMSVGRAVIAALQQARVDYYLGGSIASSIHGETRLTRDLDFIARMAPSQISGFISALGDRFYSDKEMIADAIHEHSSANVIDFEIGIKADLIFPEETEFTASKFERRIQERISAAPDAPEGWICSAEDIVLQKLLWFRMGGGVSDQQWRDVMGVLIYQAGRLDEAYLDHWASELRITDLLQRARQDSERPWNP